MYRSLLADDDVFLKRRIIRDDNDSQSPLQQVDGSYYVEKGVSDIPINTINIVRGNGADDGQAMNSPVYTPIPVVLNTEPPKPVITVPPIFTPPPPIITNNLGNTLDSVKKIVPLIPISAANDIRDTAVKDQQLQTPIIKTISAKNLPYIIGGAILIIIVAIIWAASRK